MRPATWVVLLVCSSGGVPPGAGMTLNAGDDSLVRTFADDAADQRADESIFVDGLPFEDLSTGIDGGALAESAYEILGDGFDITL